jgi:hypothetical protein
MVKGFGFHPRADSCSQELPGLLDDRLDRGGLVPVNGAAKLPPAGPKVTLYWRPGCVFCLRLRLILRWRHL